MDFFRRSPLVLGLLLSLVLFAQCSVHRNLKYFETLHASSFTHHVVKRGTKLSSHPFNTIKEVHFKTHGKDFRLILHPHSSVLHSNFKAYSVDGDGKETTVHVDRDNFYTGRVFGEKASDIKLHMEDGVITGIIHTPEETYHIEPSWRHIPEHDEKTMITYRSSDIKFSWADGTTTNGDKPRVCGYVKEGKGSVHRNLKYFETLHASSFTHHVVKRGTKLSSHPFNTIKEVHFKTHGKDFRLILHPHSSVLHSNFKAYSVDGDGKETTVHVDRDNFYTGRVFGEKASDIKLHMEDGVITGIIHTPEETYHIEPSWRHIPEHDEKTMITYRSSDIKFSWADGTTTNGDKPRVCGYVKEGKELEEDDDEEENPAQLELKHEQSEKDKYFQTDDIHVDTKTSNKRVKRQSDYEYTPTKTRCPLLLVADYRFFQEMGASNTKTTISYLISLIDRVHKIYNDTVWQDRQDMDGFKGMGFVIKKILVHSEPTRVRGGEAHYNMVREKWDVRNLLEVFSREYSHKDFCLAHLFTDLKFEGGILGLAYVGSPRRNSVGGICTPEYFKNGYTLYLNSGLSSSRNHYGQRVITREADLVTAHEFGHNWGSEHDPDVAECSPAASQGGSYLMYTYSVSGYDVNNKRFSPCSLRSIRKVLQAKSGRCFSEPEESFCGNLRVEGGEECDAGLLGTEDNDMCCDKNCKLRKNQGAVCSDKNSPCCAGCVFAPPGLVCREAAHSACEGEATCNGASADCPKAPAIADEHECAERGRCRNGSCVPYCETQGMHSCMCDIVADACKRCCRKSLNKTCFPVAHNDILPDGTPCIQGFCNKGVCEKTIQDVVERFWDIIEDININNVLGFLRDNIVGVVVLVTAFVWIPASCVISYVDRRRQRQHQKFAEWERQHDLVHPSSPRKIIHTRLPKQKPPSMKANIQGSSQL